jgi:hypothetical protein
MYNFAELMLPDGAHKRDEDTTVFLHYRRLSAPIDCFATGVHAAAGPPRQKLHGREPPPPGDTRKLVKPVHSCD